ncbi:hypothetical protein [Nostocoides sp. HKS02]|uniref:hypothetical protein n=1 Tax=Nostocoides sp. HKS02 TaxID=1813880 RepID=UPI0012B4D284|nr:hypothetical protein [Tetrasphaera sp. HKS02]QGN58775.1 hypothetical protein GKE56_13815 [Tetrasphaera sp. HKS02]
MSDVFTIDDVDGIPDAELPPPMQVWWGRYHDASLGLMTDQHGPVRGTADRVVVSHLFRVGAVTKCVSHDDIALVAGINARRDLQSLADELEPLAWGQDSLRVDGQDVAIATLAHRGLEFAAGGDFIRYPFVLIRLEGGSPPWPALRTVPAPQYIH